MSGTQEEQDGDKKQDEVGVKEGTNTDQEDEKSSQDGRSGSDESGSNDSEPEGNEDSKEEGADDLPDWVREKLTKVNSEAKSLRTRLREAEEKLQKAKSLDEVDSLVETMKSEREEAERNLLVENVALKYRLPEKLRQRLQGNTREELETDAKDLSELFSEDGDVSLEGGLTPRSRDTLPSDPRELAKAVSRRHSR